MEKQTYDSRHKIILTNVREEVSELESAKSGVEGAEALLDLSNRALGASMRKYRKLYRVTGEALARRVNVSHAHLSSLERGANRARWTENLCFQYISEVDKIRAERAELAKLEGAEREDAPDRSIPALA